MAAQVIPLKSQLARMRVPMRPVDSTSHGHDYATPDKDALKLETLETWLQEIREQPDWRRQCDIDADYYDGHQLTADILEKLRLKGFPAIKENLCRPTIDAVLGLEEKTRTDWIVKHDNDQWEEVAHAMSVKMKEAEREGQADKACSDAYAPQIKVGLGWVEVSREIVPYRYPYRVRYVHRREIAWDWRAKEPDLSDGRYLVRRQWFDEDVVKAMFPRHEKLIEMIGNQWSGWWDDVMRSGDTGLAAAWDVERATGIEEYEFRDYLRKRLCVYEIWYRTWKALPMLHLPDGRWVEYDRKNRLHVAAVAQGLIVPQILPVPKVRLSFWIGPHRLIDVPSPYKHHFFPYVPFFGYREDRSSAPYGLIRNMRDQQDEINARKQKMMWLLSSKQVVVDHDAVLDHEETRREVARADAYIVLNAHRKPTSKFEIQDNLELSDQQFKIYENAKKSLQDVAGVYQALLGKESKAESGIAINSLIEQGTTTLAEINGNYRYARRQVGGILMELVRDDIANGTTVTVGDGMQRHEVTLNEDATDEFGAFVKNDVVRAGVSLVLDDVPSTPTFRAGQLAHLTEFTKGLPDEMKALISDFIIEATDLPQRRQIGERIRRHLGLEGSRKPQNKEEAARQEGEKAEQQRKAELVRRAEEADVHNKELEGQKLQREIDTMGEEGAGEIPPEALAKVQQQVEKIVQEAQDKVRQLEAKIEALQVAMKSKEHESNTKADADTRRATIEAGAKIAVARMEAQKNEAMGDMNKKIEELLRKFSEGVEKQLKGLAERIEKSEKGAEERSRSDGRPGLTLDVGETAAQAVGKNMTQAIDKVAQPIVEALKGVAAATKAVSEATKSVSERVDSAEEQRLEAERRAAERAGRDKKVQVKKPDGTTFEVTVTSKEKGA
jgi:hypothetical protein